MDVEIIDVDALPDVKPRSPPRAYMNLISSDEEQEPVKKEKPSELKKTVQQKWKNSKRQRAADRLSQSKSKRAKTEAGPSHIAQQSGTGLDPIAIDFDDDGPVSPMDVDVNMGLPEEFLPPISPTSPSSPTDSEDEYPNIHAAFQLNNNANWNTKLFRPSSEGAVMASPRSQLQIKSPLETMKSKLLDALPKIPKLDMHEGPWFWDVAKDHSVSSQKPHQQKTAYGWGYKRDSLFKELHYDSLVQVNSFRQAGGSITRISQSAGVIGISSATPGGGPDEDSSSVVDPHNREGTLQIWLNGQNHILSEHQANVQTSNNRVHQKFYTVHDVEFDPHRFRPHIFASTGDDCIVRLWKISSEDKIASPRRTINFPEAPHDLHYNPYDFKLAITCLDGCIYVYTDPVKSLTHHPFPLAPGVRHSAGAMVWGHNDTAHHIFASSEPKDLSDSEGYHKVFDIGQLDVAYELDAKESGDGMAINSTGQQLALLTHGPEDSHKLRLYDVGHKRGKQVASVLLEPFSFSCPYPFWPDGEVTSASFSPDDMLLSVLAMTTPCMSMTFAFWGEDHLASLYIGGEKRSVDRKGLGIVSGGNDGCVRLWDVQCSDEDLSNGQVLVKTSYDIGHFSLGDKHKGEKPLVVGDNGATVSIYDWIADVENQAP
ncbi:hypothetical protein EVG20_g115 [Dentipellis fragilis]|uniref:WD40 repeat-like protein n=1 Tax=Dentipellis fragilis TaxID=205917 RepID=A0A4Y9ZFC8_9AGAM|nr:hypothetical protein EVG20_g115 [Dentipellis fragilis]